MISSVSTHPENLVESHKVNAKIIGLIHDETDAKFRKNYVDVHGIDTINKNLYDQLQRNMGKYF